MLWCKINQFLLSILPFRPWQDFLIRSHIRGCENCMGRMASREEVKALIIQESDVADFNDLWPAVKSGTTLEEPRKKTGSFLNRGWAYAAAGGVAVFLAGFLLVTVITRNGTLVDQEGEARFQINSIRVGDEPATPFLYQPKDSGMILVWAEKNM
jgi:hypothetical protein